MKRKLSFVLLLFLTILISCSDTEIIEREIKFTVENKNNALLQIKYNYNVNSGEESSTIINTNDFYWEEKKTLEYEVEVDNSSFWDFLAIFFSDDDDDDDNSGDDWSDEDNNYENDDSSGNGGDYEEWDGDWDDEEDEEDEEDDDEDDDERKINLSRSTVNNDKNNDSENQGVSLYIINKSAQSCEIRAFISVDGEVKAQDHVAAPNSIIILETRVNY